MKSLIMFLYLVLSFSLTAKCQSNDTLPVKIIWIKDLKECLLIGVVSSCDRTDTSVVISAASNGTNIKGKRKIEVGQTYIFAVEKDLAIASPPKKMSVKFKNVIVWTNEEPYKFKPRECLNCIGQYVKW